MERFLAADHGEASPKGGPGSAEGLLQWTSAAMMGSALVAFTFEGLAYNLVFLARVLPAVNRTTMVLPLFVVFNMLWVLAVWSYLQAHSRDPGVVPPGWHEFVSRVGDGLTIVPAVAEWQPGKATFCRKCVRPRPERAHHCCICGTCILRMDHHCPWIGNCVGFHNHKFFLLLGSYASLACFVTLMSASPELVCSIQAMAGVGPADNAWRQGLLGTSDQLALLLLIIIALAVFLFLAHMMAVHLSLATRNSTSIEDFYENMHNPFDQGNARANLAEVFGAFGPDWLLPIRPLRPLGDGVSFPTTGEGHGSCEEGEAVPNDSLGVTAELLWRRRYRIRSPDDGGPPSPAPPGWVCGPFRPPSGRSRSRDPQLRAPG